MNCQVHRQKFEGPPKCEDVDLNPAYVSCEIWEKKFDRGSRGRLAPAVTTAVCVDVVGMVEEYVSRCTLRPPTRHVVRPPPEWYSQEYVGVVLREIDGFAGRSHQEAVVGRVMSDIFDGDATVREGEAVNHNTWCVDDSLRFSVVLIEPNTDMMWS